MRRLSPCIIVLFLASSGCATTFAIIDTNDVMTSSQTSTTPQGERQETITRARYSPAHRGFVCESAWRYPRETVHTWKSGYDMGGRLAIGFIGAGELLFGGIIAGEGLSSDTTSTTEKWAAGAIGAALVIDGVATILIASLIDDFEENKSDEREGAWHTLEGCPESAELVIGTTRVGTDQARILRLPDSVILGTDQLELAIHHQNRVFPLEMNTRDRCSLGASLGASMPECEDAVQETELVLPELRFELDINIRIEDPR